MPKLTKSDVLHIAKLASLKLTSKEVRKFSGQLSDVIDFISKLNEVNVKGLEPTAQVTGLENVYRDDIDNASKGLSQEETLSGTDKIYNGYFKVHAILSERSDK